jgi:4-diphosphocytidyl-2-C-methyl-D-erythritol kinase
MINFPACKINLGLNILFKRPDGYHEIETAMLEIPVNDCLEIIPADTDQFEVNGLEIPGTGNLILDAVELLRRDFELENFYIRLEKNIPMGGGLGGGSSDAAKTLVLINEIASLKLSDKQLEDYAAKLGSDCPFFVNGGLQLCTGRGEILKPLKITLPKMWLVLVNIGIHVPTATAYAEVQPQSNQIPITDILQMDSQAWKEYLKNDFETSVFSKHPELQTIKDAFYRQGAFYSAMSGSGSTMFGLFEQQPEELKFPFDPVFQKMVKL